MEPASARPQRRGRIGLGLIGAVAGGILGHFAFLWIARQGFYALALPGTMAGLGCGWLVKERSAPLAGVCFIWALALGIYSEWRWAPFTVDHSFGYFLAHFTNLRPLTLIMILLGGVFGCWFAIGKRKRAA